MESSMHYRTLGHSGLRVSEVSLGSWLTFGSAVGSVSTRDIVRAAYDLGINFFDTADVYSRGAAEEALGDAIRDLPRAHLVIATKAFFPMSDRPNDHGLSRKHLIESVEGSLQRLGTDYIDLHQCHRSDPSVPLGETVRTYEDLIRQGKLLYWGVSEWQAVEIVDACRTADAWRAYRPISNQPEYSLLERKIERELIPVCAREGLGQVVWSPLAQGVLTGKYGGGATPAGTRGADKERSIFMHRFLRPDVISRVEQLRPFADELGVSLAQLALAWCLRQPNVASVIAGATSVRQVEDNARASGVRIPDEIAAKIDALFPAD